MAEGYDSYRVNLFVSGSCSVSKGRAVVSSVSRWATQFGISLLKSGGNAFDAAFGVGLSLSLFHPQAGNIGGGGYALLFKADSGKPIFINYREKAPISIDINSYFKADGTLDPEKSSFGPTSICVPGSVKAFFYMHKRYGKLPSKDILREIADLSLEGYPLTKYQVECLNRLSPKLSFSPESKRIYVKDTEYKEGDIFVNKNLAKTFELLAEYGEDSFYRGEIADAMVRDISTNGGFLSSEDLANYEIKIEEPIYTEIGGKKVWTVPPEGGGAVLINLLNILDNDDFKNIGYGTGEYYHRLAQALKISFINRYAYLGDVDYKSNSEYRRIFDKDQWYRVYRKFLSRDVSRSYWIDRFFKNNRDIQQVRDYNTTHFSIIDDEGNAVSNSYTLNLRYGSKWSIDGYGFLMNGSIDAFSFKQGVKNYFGILGNRANLVSPGKRPASSMAPVIVTDKNGVFGLIGTPGGPTIPSTIFNVLWPLINNFDISPEKAVSSGRIHHQAWPDELYLEKDKFPASFAEEMARRGYRIEFKNEPIGDVHAVFRSSEEGVYTGISDYRREGMSMAI